LGEITRELTWRNNDGNFGRELVMGVTNSRGIVPMQTIGSDLTRYNILPPRAFAYNPIRIKVGSIARLRLPSEVLVPTMFCSNAFPASSTRTTSTTCARAISGITTSTQADLAVCVCQPIVMTSPRCV
jgi:hypothetical protein